jgi:hypothetical protein
MKKYSETPSLGKGQEWTPKSGPSPFREHIASGVPFPPTRPVDSERATRWNDPTANAKAAKSKNAPARGKRK